MADLQLTRTQDDRRQYALGDIGTLRLQGFTARTAIARAGGARWRFAYGGFWQRRVTAADEAGVTVGEFAPRSLRRGGTLRWGGRDLELRAASNWRERYALVDGDREVAVIEARTWGRRPVKVTVQDSAELEPGLLLFACFVVRGLAEDASAEAAVVVSAG